jgi:hypothetical protein
VSAAAMSRPRRHCTRQPGSIRHLRRLGTISATCSTIKGDPRPPSNACARRVQVAPDYSDAMFNLALLLQRTNQCAEAADYWRHYLANDGQSEWGRRLQRLPPHPSSQRDETAHRSSASLGVPSTNERVLPETTIYLAVLGGSKSFGAAVRPGWSEPP